MDIAYNQILIFLLQCFIIATLILTLFRLRTIFGLGLLFITLGVFQFIQVFLASSFYIEIYPGILFSSGSMVLFSGSLFAVLLIYIREDALEARKLIYALIGANVVLGLLLAIFSYAINIDQLNNYYNLSPEFFLQNARVLVVGTLTFLVDAFVIIFFYEFISKYVKVLFLRMLFTMTFVLSLDSLLFSLGVFYGQSEFNNILISGLISKSLAAVVYSSFFTLYLIYFDNKYLKSESKSDSYKDIFNTLTFRQKYEDVFEEMKIKSNELEEAQEIAQLGSYSLDLKTEYFTSSPIFDNIIGFTKKDIKSHLHYRSLVHPDHVARNDKLFLDSLKSGKLFKSEYRIFRNDNRALRWINEQGKVIYKNGEPYRFKGTIQDISQRKLIEQKLKASEDRFQFFANASFEGIAMAVDGIIIDVNQRFTELTGYSREELLDHPLMMVIYPADKSKVSANTDIDFEASSEFRILRKNGTIQHVESRCKNIMFNGKNTRLVNLYDISERMEIKNQLIKSEEKFSKAYFNNPTPIFISSIPEGKFIDVNPMFEKVSGFSRKDLIGKKVTDLDIYYNDEDRFKLFEEIEKKGKLQGYEIIFKAKSGEPRDCLMFSEIIDIDSKPSLLSIINDVTEQNRTEKALKKQNEDLTILGNKLSENNRLLNESQAKFKNIFDKNPVSLWEEDYTEVKRLLFKKKAETTDLKKYLDKNPGFVIECISKLEILNVNDISLQLFGVQDKQELITHLAKTFNEKSMTVFKEELIAIVQNKKEYSAETEFIRSDGKIINVLIKFVNISDNDRAIVSIVNITELNKAKEKIVESEKRFRELYEKSGDAILILKNGIFIECNQAAIDMLGYQSRDEFLNSHPSKLSPIFQHNGKKSFDMSIDMMNLALKQGTHRFEWIHTKMNGENFPVEVLLTVISNKPNNQIIHTVWRDITDRKSAELELKMSERELRKSQEIAQLGTYNIDLTSELIKSSSIFDSIVGFRTNDIKSFDQLRKRVHPEELEENLKMFQNCIETGKLFDREFRMLNPITSEVKWIHGLGEIVYKGNTPNNFRGTLQDITERKLNELAIKLNEKKLIEVQKIANIGTYEIDLKTNSVATSNLYDSIIGIKKKPKHNKGWWKSITHPDDYESSELKWQQCIKDGKNYRDEYRIINDKKEVKWIYDLAEIKCENGTPTKVVGTIQDITLRKTSEEKIKRSDTILSQVNSLVKVIDKHGNITYASPSFKNILGFEPEEMLGLGWWMKTTPNFEMANKLREEVLDVVTKNAPLSEALKNRWIKSKDGELKLFDWVSSKGENNSLIFIGIDVTEKQEKEKQFKTLTETAQDAIILVDHKGLIFEWNKSSEDTFGYTKKEIIGKTITTLMPEKYRTQYKKGFNLVMKNALKKTYRNNVVEGLTNNGKVFPMELSISYWKSNHKNVYCYFIRDITELEREEKIKEVIFNITKKANETLSLDMFFNFIKTELGKLINTNNFFIALYNEKTDMISTPYMVDEIDTGDDFPKGESLTGHVIDTKKAILTRAPYIKSSSEEEKILGLGPESKCWMGVPLLVNQMAIGAMVVQSYTDENAYSQEDVALLELIASNIASIIKKSEDLDKITLLNKALIQSPLGIIVTNLNSEIEYTNPAFTKLSGYTEADVIGRNPRILQSGEHSKDFYKNIYDTLSKGNTWYGEIINRHKDGRKFLTEANISSVKNNNGHPTHYIMVYEDITEKRLLERQFINAFIEAQEVEKQNFGEELHDGISQILSAEGMYISLLIEQNQDRINDKAKFLTKIKELNTSAVNETRNIAHGLMSSQLKQSGLLIAVKNICVDFNSSKTVKFNFRNKDIKEEELSNEIKTNVFRIIQELTTNINRYSSATKASIKFKKIDVNKIRLIVKDNGVGMDYDKIKEAGKVTGLQNVERRIILLNGTYTVESAPKKGTCWKIEIPL